ncbi:hypothetical protein CRUP_013432 [Coryphaenoides rupestris]|nr:hypothetical protein CRUP_013432 [Coryphaenoides rupestris]
MTAASSLPSYSAWLWSRFFSTFWNNTTKHQRFQTRDRRSRGTQNQEGVSLSRPNLKEFRDNAEQQHIAASRRLLCRTRHSGTSSSPSSPAWRQPSPDLRPLGTLYRDPVLSSDPWGPLS